MRKSLYPKRGWIPARAPLGRNDGKPKLDRAQPYEFLEESKRILRYRPIKPDNSSLLLKMIPIHNK